MDGRKVTRFQYLVASVVTLVWSVVYLTDVYSKEFTAPPEVTGVMLAVVTAILGPSVVSKWKGTNGNGGG